MTRSVEHRLTLLLAGLLTALGLAACGPSVPGSSDQPIAGDPTDAGSDADEADAGNESDDGEAPDAGEEPDAGEMPDAGWPEDGVLMPAPDGIDCDDPAQASGRWCTKVCMPFSFDAGWGERVRVRRPSEYYATFPSTCPRHMDGGNLAVMWRAPYAGTWVIDGFGSEGTWLRGVVDAYCSESPSSPLWCGGGPKAKTVKTFEAGQAVLILSESAMFMDVAPKVHQINITPLVEHESGADCQDGADNDADGLPDCKDPDCAESPECTTPLCAQEILPSRVPLHVQGELTVEDHMNMYEICRGHDTRERHLAWKAPFSGRFIADLSESNFASSLTVHRGGCNGPHGNTCRSRDPYAAYYEAVAAAFDADAGEWIYIRIGGISDPLTFGRRDDPRHRYKLVIREPLSETGARCDDDIDNDGDGRVDYDDPDCPDF